MAERVQLKRRKGWNKPTGAITVARPTRWGNPYRVADYDADYPELSIEAKRAMAVSDFRGMIEGKWGEEHHYPITAVIRAELGGRDLACWCPPGVPCHADVLLALANRA